MKNKIKIIYEDNHLLVCEKPVNMPVQADSSGDEDLLSTVKAYIKEKYSKPGEVYLGLVHRLDRPVGGVMVFARTSKAAARLAESFKNRKTKKRYAAIVSGSPCSSAELECDLLRDEQNNISRVVRPNHTPAQKPQVSNMFRQLQKMVSRCLMSCFIPVGTTRFGHNWRGAAVRFSVTNATIAPRVSVSRLRSMLTV